MPTYQKTADGLQTLFFCPFSPRSKRVRVDGVVLAGVAFLHEAQEDGVRFYEAPPAGSIVEICVATYEDDSDIVTTTARF